MAQEQYSTQRAVSDGTLIQLRLSLKYLDREDIAVFVGGLPSTDWRWVDDTLIAFPAAIPPGVEVMVKRSTDISKLRHHFTGGAAFTAQTLDEDFLQGLYIGQEAIEGGTLREVFNDVDMHGYRFFRLGDATLDDQAVTLRQAKAESTLGWQAAAAAEASKVAAKASELAAKASEDNVAASAAAASASKDAAAASATAAKSSETGALASANAAASSATASAASAVTSEHWAKLSQAAAIPPGSIGTPELADLSVTGQKLADGAVSGTKLGTGSVTGTKIAPGTVGGAHLAAQAVSTQKIADKAVTADKLGDDVTGKIGGIPVGGVMWWPSRAAIPVGYVTADGQLVSREVWPSLWAEVQAGRLPSTADSTWLGNQLVRANYTAGDGSTTFRLPDMNGMQVGSVNALFTRGAAGPASVSGGTINLDTLQAHYHAESLGLNIGSGDYDIYKAGRVATSGKVGTLSGTATTAPMRGVTSVPTDAAGGGSGIRTGTETVPVHVIGVWIIRAGGTVADPAQVTSAAMVQRMTQLEADMLLRERGSVVSGPSPVGQYSVGVFWPDWARSATVELYMIVPSGGDVVVQVSNGSGGFVSGFAGATTTSAPPNSIGSAWWGSDGARLMYATPPAGGTMTGSVNISKFHDTLTMVNGTSTHGAVNGFVNTLSGVLNGTVPTGGGINLSLRGSPAGPFLAGSGWRVRFHSN